MFRTAHGQSQHFQDFSLGGTAARSVDTSALVAGFASESVDTTVVAEFGRQTLRRPPRQRIYRGTTGLGSREPNIPEVGGRAGATTRSSEPAFTK